MPPVRLLVTGFGPFPSMPRNPSARIARRVAASPRWRVAGVEARSLILTTAYATLPGEFDPALDARPDAILMIGVAGRSRGVRVEWRATARRSTLFPDQAGAAAARPAAPAEARRCRLPHGPLVRLVRRQALPARASRDAGRYLCNASYFRALGTGRPCVFVHIPKGPMRAPDGTGRLRRTSDDRLVSALVEVGSRLLSRASRPR